MARKSKANYVPNKNIKSITVKRGNKTTEIQNKDILDGAYVKKNVKFKDGGSIDVEIVQDKAYGKGYFVIRDYRTGQILHDSIEGIKKAYRIAEFQNDYNVVYSEGDDDYEYAKGGSMYRTGGVMGDIYSIQNAEQFKQLITTYNELSEKFGVVNYFLDHKDNSVAFLMQRDEESMSNTLKLQRYIDTLNDRGFDVFDKTKNKNIIIKEDNSQGGGYVYFKLKLSKIVRYADGGGVGQNVRGIAYYITSDSAGDDYRYLSGSFLSKEEFDNFYGDDAILDFYFNVNVEYDWQLEKAIYQQMLDEEVREEGIHIIGYKISRSDNDDIESNLPYDDNEDYANGGGVGESEMNNGVIYEVYIDRGESGTETIADFEKRKDAVDFIYDYNLKHPKAKLGIDTITSDFTSGYADGGGVGKSKSYLHLYKLTYSDGLYIVESYDGYAMSPKEAMEKMRINIRGLKSYKYKVVSSNNDKYKEWYDRKDIGYSNTEAWDEVFGSDKYANGGRLTSNADIIEAFLTSNREAKVGNLSTHYNEYDNEILLRNYGTLIASRKGNNLRITSTKYSITTTKNTNMVNRMAKEKGLDVKYVEKFEDGGNTSCWCYEVGGL
jgi:hypothetical protein